ncbi:MAG: type IV pilus secretin PilQ [Nitrospinales bacterium]
MTFKIMKNFLESNQALKLKDSGFLANERYVAMKKFLVKQVLLVVLVCMPLSIWSPAFSAQESFYVDGIQVAQESEFPSSDSAEGEAASEEVNKKKIIRLTVDEVDSVVTIEIQGTDKLDYTAFKLMNPLRIVLDMPDMELGDLADSEIVVDQGVVSSVKPVYFEDTNVLRLEISLNKPAAYEISQDVESQVLVKLKNATSESLAAVPSEEVADVETDQVTENVEKVEAPEPVEPVVEEVPSEQLVETVEEEIPTAESVEPTTDEAEVAQLIDPVEEESPATESMESVENDAMQDQEFSNAVEEVSTSTPTISDSSEPVGMNPCSDDDSGEFKRISFDFQNANLKNILRIIAEVAGFNLVLSQDVQGTTNLKMTDVPWNKALSLILSNNGLARDCDGIIMRVATEATLEASRVEGVLVTEMIRINYADLAKLVPSLAGIKSARGSIKTDKRTSTLIVTDVQEIISDMRNIIKNLDKPTQQVTVSMQIVEIETNAAREFGIGWSVDSNRETGVDFPNSVSIGDSVVPGAIGASTNDFQVDLADVINPTGSMFFSLATNGLLGVGTRLSAELRALESRGLSRTLSRPKITTLDNTEAKIRKGVRVPLVTSTANEGVTVEFVDADLELSVTPHITSDEKIFMKLLATKNSVGAIVGTVGASINTSEARSEMLVDNGSTSVLGGLTSHNSNDGTSAIPFLGDLPWIGWLFRNSIKDLTIDELLIFITPTIVRN